MCVQQIYYAEQHLALTQKSTSSSPSQRCCPEVSNHTYNYFDVGRESQTIERTCSRNTGNQMHGHKSLYNKGLEEWE
jgi:hypothetical protein